MTVKPRVRKSTVTWLMVCQTAAHLQFMATQFDAKYIRSEANFIAAVRHAVRFGGVTIPEIARAASCSIDEVQQWVLDDVHKNEKQHPTKKLREKVLSVLRDSLHNRSINILLEIESPPRNYLVAKIN